MSAAEGIRLPRAPRSDDSDAGSRRLALLCAGAIVALVFAQDFAPAWPGFHTWQYAAAVVLAAAGAGSYTWNARKGADGAFAFPLGVAMAGALVVAVAGLASGLLGPDTQTLERAPGAVAPLPEAGAAAFFPNVDSTSLARGDIGITLRRRDGSSLELLAGQRRFLGAAALVLEPHVAAYVEARDARGDHLTITQPTNAAFLSSLLQFPQAVPIAGQTLPADQFAIPSAHRQIKAFYFSRDATSKAHVRGFAGEDAVLFAVDDENGKLVPNGIGLARSGDDIQLAGLRLRVTIGTYPGLAISAVPLPLALGLGSLCLAGGVLAAVLRVPLAGRRLSR